MFNPFGSQGETAVSGHTPPKRTISNLVLDTVSASLRHSAWVFISANSQISILCVGAQTNRWCWKVSGKLRQAVNLWGPTALTTVLSYKSLLQMIFPTGDSGKERQSPLKGAPCSFKLDCYMEMVYSRTQLPRPQ